MRSTCCTRTKKRVPLLVAMCADNADNIRSEPLSSTRLSCSTTSAISFLSCSRLLASFLSSVICLTSVSMRCASVLLYESERIKMASGSSKGYFKQLERNQVSCWTAYSFVLLATSTTDVQEIYTELHIFACLTTDGILDGIHMEWH